MLILTPFNQQVRPTKNPTRWVAFGAFVFLLIISSSASPTSAALFSTSGTTPGLLKNALVIPQKVKNFFLPPPSSSTSSSVGSGSQIIRVVSEESQVITVVKNSADAVVSIIASSEVPILSQCGTRTPIQGLPQGLEGYFNIPELCQNGTELKRVGAGSGFIASPDGYIITNKHVVTDEKGEYTVILNDQQHLGQKLKATVIARSPEQDIAILKVDARDLPFLGLGDSSALQVGQTAIAIGYALGEFDNTVSKGVVSGLSRSISASNGVANEQLRGLIQTDAAINPGNSGGPLLDIGGNVIGMNTAVANAQSIGFAIPSNEIRIAFEQARLTGKIVAPERAFLGVRYLQITPELQTKLHLTQNYGVLIGKGASSTEPGIVPNSPAAKAGLEEGDIILEADGKQLNERNLLVDSVTSHKPGDTLDIKILRKGEQKNIRVVLEKKI